ncbi:MAG: thioredoxin family protein [Thermoplasmatota archaeon]
MEKGEILELDKEKFEEITSRCENLIVVMFYTNSCPNCRAMEPIYRKISGELDGIATLTIVNANLHQDLAMRYGIYSVPTFKFFCRGQPIGELVGAMNRTLLRNTIKDFASMKHNCVTKSSKVVYELTGYA